MKDQKIALEFKNFLINHNNLNMMIISIINLRKNDNTKKEIC